MNSKQTVKEFIKPLFAKHLENERNYRLKKCQIIRANAAIKCMEELSEPRRKIANKHKMIKRYEKHLLKMQQSTHWTENVLGGIGQMLVDHFKGHSYEILGPFGLSNKTSLWVWASEEDQKNSDHAKLLASITFIPCHIYSDFESGHKLKEIDFYVKDYSKTTNDYPDQSIGALNGMNTPNVNIMEWPMEKLIEFASKK